MFSWKTFHSRRADKLPRGVPRGGFWQEPLTSAAAAGGRPFHQSRRMKWFLTFCLCGLPLAAPTQTYQEKAVAAVLMGEAWSEGAKGMAAVAEVIHQRAMEKGRTPLQVVAAYRGRIHAFSCINGTSLDRLIRKFSREPDYQQALRLAETVCQFPDRLPGVAMSANHYTRVTERPVWAKGKRPVAVIGRHAFYRLKHY
jgi:spore germination cell wall hydrolase CwlJ-like protein